MGHGTVGPNGPFFDMAPAFNGLDWAVPSTRMLSMCVAYPGQVLEVANDCGTVGRSDPLEGRRH